MKLILSIIFLGVLGITLLYAHEGYTTIEMEASQEDVGICPVTYAPASGEHTYTYEGKTYYFCCLMCIDEFKKDPQKYISKIKEIKVEAYQYGFSPDPIIVKKQDIVKLKISSRDIAHGLYIKEYGINVAVEKDKPKHVEFIADKEGKFDILCSVYCGPGHSEMKGKFIVEK